MLAPVSVSEPSPSKRSDPPPLICPLSVGACLIDPERVLAVETGACPHTAIREEDFWDKIEELRAAGASEILVSSLDKLLL
mgnify:CR=1 FL=1